MKKKVIIGATLLTLMLTSCGTNTKDTNVNSNVSTVQMQTESTQESTDAKVNESTGNTVTMYDILKEEDVVMTVPEVQNVYLMMNIIESPYSYYNSDWEEIELGSYSLYAIRPNDGSETPSDTVIEAQVINGKLELPEEINGKKIQRMASGNVGNNLGLCSVNFITEYRDNGKPVITDLVIPDSVIDIDSQTIANMPLQSITMSKNVKNIDSGNFYHTLLTEITIPNEDAVHFSKEKIESYGIKINYEE